MSMHKSQSTYLKLIDIKPESITFKEDNTGITLYDIETSKIKYEDETSLTN